MLMQTPMPVVVHKLFWTLSRRAKKGFGLSWNDHEGKCLVFDTFFSTACINCCIVVALLFYVHGKQLRSCPVS